MCIRDRNIKVVFNNDSLWYRLHFIFTYAFVILIIFTSVSYTHLAVFLLCFFLGRNLSVENPGRRQVAVEAGVKFLNDFFSETLGEKGKDYIPYLAVSYTHLDVYKRQPLKLPCQPHPVL